MQRHGTWILAGLVLLAIAGGGIVWAVWPTTTPAPTWVADYDLTARRPDEIAPGTVIDRTAPPGWSHLVIKSLPRVKPGEEKKVPSNLVTGSAGTVRMASWMFTAFVADVTPELPGHPTRYRLRALGLGLGSSSNGRDIVYTPETAKQFGVNLDWITKEILTKGYATQRMAVTVLHGSSFALMDTPVWFRCTDKNRLVRYRYALLVDPPTGRLDVLVWSLGGDGGGCNELTELVRVLPDTIDEAELVPDPTEFNAAGIPTDAAFAVEKLPPGRRIAIPPELRGLAAHTRFTTDEARMLETRLRKLIAEAP